MQSTQKRVKKKGGQLVNQGHRALHSQGMRGHGTKASIFHSFLSSLVTQYRTYTFKQTLVVGGGGKGKN